jgi:hypothetical protein
MKLKKRLVFPLGFVCGLFIAWVIYKPYSAPPDMVFGTHGYFPLYDTNCIARVNISRHPQRSLRFQIIIEALADTPICLEGSKLSVEGFNAEGEKVYYQEFDWHDFKVFIPHPTQRGFRWRIIVFDKYTLPEKQYACAGDTYLPFKRNEEGFYVIRVISPCEKYECVSTTLESKMFN